MQRYKEKFMDKSLVSYTEANIQRCVRTQDIDLVGDGTHFIDFEMLGLFSFRHWELQHAINFFMEFMTRINVTVETVTIHPDMLQEWQRLYENYNVKVVADNECVWTDGTIGGYCTEFYVNGVEIGNIVNTLGTCIDVGFGVERLMMVLGNEPKTQKELLLNSFLLFEQQGIIPSNKQHGYIMRKIATALIKIDPCSDHHSELLKSESRRIAKAQEKYEKIKHKYPDKSPYWWKDTHGIDVDELGS